MTVIIQLLAVFVYSTHGFSTRIWLNDWEEPIEYECPHGQVISRVSSKHLNKREDRVWDLSCQLVGAERICKTYDWANHLTKTLSFTCGTSQDSAIVGMEAVFDKDTKDRRFKYTCCLVPFINKKSCRQTAYANRYDRFMNLQLAYNEVIIGMYSVYKTYTRDRRWKMNVCKLY